MEAAAIVGEEVEGADRRHDHRLLGREESSAPRTRGLVEGRVARVIDRDIRAIRASAQHEAQPRGGADVRLHECADLRLGDARIDDGAGNSRGLRVQGLQAHAGLLAMEGVGDAVVANLRANSRPQGNAGEARSLRDAEASADLRAVVVLLSSPAVDRAVDLLARKERVVEEELQVGTNHERRRFEVAVLPASSVRGGGHEALARSPLRRIHQVPPTQTVRTGVGRGSHIPVPFAADRTRWEDTGSVPGCAVAHQGEGEIAPIVELARGTRVEVQALMTLRMKKRTVVGERLSRDHGAPALPEVGGVHQDGAPPAVRTDLGQSAAFVEVVGEADIDRACGGEVAHACGVRPLGPLHGRDDLRD
jgi:hypothetical protein